ncbi:hypothetical protein PV733_15450 [Streptomyces europaeiscabiei]|nr:hypothetical protein [Streptomyces europaeiscabiei]MDX3710332.1 hypothetical protein [Streptomyces europaeiscabiei]
MLSEGAHALADPEIGHLLANGHHSARTAVADYVRASREWHHQPGQQVAALDADRLDFDQHLVAAGHGVGDLLVAEFTCALGISGHHTLGRRCDLGARAVFGRHAEGYLA